MGVRQPNYRQPVLHATKPQATCPAFNLWTTKPQATSPSTDAQESLWNSRHLQPANTVQLFLHTHILVVEPQNRFWNNLEGPTCNMQALFSGSFSSEFLMFLKCWSLWARNQCLSIGLGAIWRVPPATWKPCSVVDSYAHSFNSVSFMFRRFWIYMHVYVYVYTYLFKSLYIFVHIYFVLFSYDI